ncbi:N-acetylmuramoyl-L-alanine amidase [Fluviibacterium sp. DFM31]|uniref:N-acetylmuramoyl-L-alanine amidase n=1 Tax=Meridianimarinicoccus marinus TaxID=3231483 RepID=A0ABV3L4W3_9RHOB
MIWHPSPNFGPRRNGAQPGLIVLHYTAMDSAEAALERLCSTEHEVSAHYLIGRDGTCWQLVREADRAWHAGAGFWAGQGDVNSRSIGIELDNDGKTPFSEPLIARLEALLGKVMAAWQIAPQAVIGHSDMAPDRKSDPGARFDWRRLARQGLAVWPEAATAPATDPDAFARLARAFGYPDASHDVLLTAVRDRFRPAARGPLSAEDMAVIADLARRFPVDPAAVPA